MVAAVSRRRLATTSVVTGSMLIFDHQDAIGVEARDLAGQHHRGRVELVDDGRPAQPVAGRELGAVIDLGREEPGAAEIEQAPLPDERTLAVPVARGQALQLEPWHL